jgi:hypothetical protein
MHGAMWQSCFTCDHGDYLDYPSTAAKATCNHDAHPRPSALGIPLQYLHHSSSSSSAHTNSALAASDTKCAARHSWKYTPAFGCISNITRGSYVSLNPCCHSARVLCILQSVHPCQIFHLHHLLRVSAFVMTICVFCRCASSCDILWHASASCSASPAHAFLPSLMLLCRSPWPRAPSGMHCILRWMHGPWAAGILCMILGRHVVSLWQHLYALPQRCDVNIP